MINREITDNVIFDLSFFLSLSYLNTMENLNIGIVSIPMSMTASPNVKGGNWWESDFGKEFPISSMETNGAEATVIIGYPHPDYRILTHLKNGKMDGESTLFSENKVRIAIMTFVEGIANGPCTIYYENGMHYFEGRFVNGYREGLGKEYDEKGNLIYDGLYEKGKRQVELSRTSGCSEKTKEPKVNVQIVKSSENNSHHKGVKAYFDESGEILRLYEWNEGLEIPFNGFYKLYDEKNKKWIEGEYRDGIRNGACKEYEENGKLVFDGYFENGKKLYLVRLPEMNGYWKEFDDNGALKCVCKKDKDGQNEGVCYFYENGKLKKISEWKQGKEIATSGYYKFYDDSKGIWYEGKYRNGIREGKSKEYSRNGNILFEGYTINGNKLFPMNDMKPFWKEVDTDNRLVRICEINDDGRYDGVSYFYQNGDIYRISKWKDGKETEVLKMFNGRTMNEFKEGKLWYSGGYVRNGDFDFIREGRGEEYDSDGVTLVYKGSLQNGKRNGHGKEYHKGKVVYDGEWVKGMRKWHYYLYMVLLLAFMLLSAAACFYIFNGYVGTVVSGIYVVVTCFYCSKKAGIVSSLLFIELICFLIHLYAGLSVLLAIIVICLSFWFNVLTGLIPLGLVVTAISYYYNIYAGIFVSGVFLTFMVFYIVHQCDWKMNVVYSSAGVIFGICIITSLIIGLNQNEIMKYILIFAIGLFLIYLLFLIVHYSASKMKIVYSSAGLILSSCSMICSLMGVKEFEVLKYILIFVIGLILIFLIFELSACCDWEMGVVYSSAGVILLGCIIAWLSMVLIQNKIMKYILIFVIGLFLIYLVLLIVYYNNWEINVVHSSAVVIFGICLITALIFGSFEVSFMKYILIGVIGIILIAICFAICSNEIEVAITGTIIIIATCIVTGLIFVFAKNGVIKYILIFAVGTYIVFIIYLIMALSDSKEMGKVNSSAGVIFGICIITGLSIGLNQNKIMKYFLIFAIGIFVEYLVLLIVHYNDMEMNVVFSSAGVIFGICLITALIFGSFEVSVVRYMTIGLIGILLIVLCFVKYRGSMDVAFTGTIYIIAACIMTGLITNDSNNSKHVLIFTIGTYVACIVYLMCAIFDWKMGIVFGVSLIIMGACSLASFIVGSLVLSIFKYIPIGMFGLGLIILCLVILLDEDKVMALTGAILIFVASILTGLLIGFIGKAGFKYILTILIGTLIVITIFMFTLSLSEFPVEIVWISATIVYAICTVTSLIMGSFEVTYLKYISIGLLGISLIIPIGIIFSDNIEAAITGTVLIIATCIMTGLIFKFSETNGMKYILVIAIGIYITMIVYAFTAMCEEDDMDIVWATGFCILIICFIIMSFYNSIIRILTIIFISIYVLGVVYDYINVNC